MKETRFAQKSYSTLEQEYKLKVARYISNTLVNEYIILSNYFHLVSVLKLLNPTIKTTHPPTASIVKTFAATAACEQKRSQVICILLDNIIQLRCELY